MNTIDAGKQTLVAGDTLAKKDATITQIGWLNVSINGFGDQQRCRPLGHLVKELVQNGMDAIDAAGGVGQILLTTSNVTENSMTLTCEDSGGGIESLAQINTVFSTSKHDSVTARGRMGQGFKEILSIATSATVISRDKKYVFATTEDGTKTVTQTTSDSYCDGMIVTMDIEHDECGTPLYPYFSKFIVRPGLELSVEGVVIPSREPTQEFRARMPTEIHDGTRWRNRTEETTLSLVPTVKGAVGYIYEMGIPVCPIGWKQPFDVDIAQRIPLNPNRDAVKNNFDRKVRSVCFPQMLDLFDTSEMTADWVADAALESGDADLVKTVVTAVFGEKIALGKAGSGGDGDDNDEARYEGFTVVDPSHLSGSLAKILRSTAPTVKEVAKQRDNERLTEEEKRALPLESVIYIFFGPDLELPKVSGGDARDYTPNPTLEHIWRIGPKIVIEHMEFARFLTAKVLNVDEEDQNVSVSIGEGYKAKWQGDGTLTLSLTEDSNWMPLNDEFLATIIHEVSHSSSMSHGRVFYRAVEENAGKVAMIMLHQDADDLRQRFPHLMQMKADKAIPETADATIPEPVVMVAPDDSSLAVPREGEPQRSWFSRVLRGG